LYKVARIFYVLSHRLYNHFPRFMAFAAVCGLSADRVSIGVHSAPATNTPAPNLPVLRCAPRLQARRCVHNLGSGHLFDIAWSGV